LALFLLLCVAPTAVVLGWAAVWRSSWHAESEARQLALRLGAKVSFSAVRHPRPGVVVYEGFQLSDPAGGTAALRCRAVEAGWVREGDFEHRDRDFLVVRLTGAEVEESRFDELRRLADRALARRTGWSAACVKIEAGDVTLLTDRGPRPLAAVQARMESLARGTWARLGFRPDPQSDESCAVCISRDEQAETPAVYLDLKTGNAGLPASLLALGWNEWAILGAEASFRGTAQADRSPKGWSGSATGRIAGIDLRAFVAGQAPHAMSGSADLTLDALEFRNGRVVRASGSLIAPQGGAVSRSLLDAVRRSLALTVKAEGTYLTVPFDQLAFAFAIESGRLTLQGRCPLGGQDATAVLIGRGEAIVESPASQSLPLTALAEMLAPVGAAHVPLGPQTHWLLQRFALGDGSADRGVPATAEAPRPEQR
jgi:hypothetical protein